MNNIGEKNSHKSNFKFCKVWGVRPTGGQQKVKCSLKFHSLDSRSRSNGHSLVGVRSQLNISEEYEYATICYKLHHSIIVYSYRYTMLHH